MEIKITSLVETDLFPFSHSAHEGGENVGRNTWNAAKDEGTTFLDTDEKKEAFKDFVEDSGRWTREEIDAWSDLELNALFLQWVAGDVRESPAILEGVSIYQNDIQSDEWFFSLETSPDMETGPYESYFEAYEGAALEMRNRPGYPSADSISEIDWTGAEYLATQGKIAGRIFQGTDGEVYFYIGS